MREARRATHSSSLPGSGKVRNHDARPSLEGPGLILILPVGNPGYADGVKTVLHWFRRDLRVSDNTALSEAARRADLVALNQILDGRDAAAKTPCQALV